MHAADALVSSFSAVDIKHLHSLVLVRMPLLPLLKANAQTLQKIRIVFPNKTSFDSDILAGNQTLRCIEVKDVDCNLVSSLQLFGSLFHLKALKTISLHLATDLDADDGWDADVFLSAYSPTGAPADLALVKKRLPAVAGKISHNNKAASRIHTFGPHAYYATLPRTTTAQPPYPPQQDSAGGYLRQGRTAGAWSGGAKSLAESKANNAAAAPMGAGAKAYDGGYVSQYRPVAAQAVHVEDGGGAYGGMESMHGHVGLSDAEHDEGEESGSEDGEEGFESGEQLACVWVLGQNTFFFLSWVGLALVAAVCLCSSLPPSFFALLFLRLFCQPATHSIPYDNIIFPRSRRHYLPDSCIPSPPRTILPGVLPTPPCLHTTASSLAALSLASTANPLYFNLNSRRTMPYVYPSREVYLDKP
ncbi:hypothetical protein C8J57DRAFT_1611069 [Mycena rebaudengoi]|nr:hypothetical protein C8J57DRAFT_1611069 [Mycena rebaudengoi]